MIGTRIRLRYTGETGTIVSLLDDGMVGVRLDNDPGFVLPAFEEDLDRNLSSPVAAPILGGKKPGAPAPPPPPLREIKSPQPITEQKGVQVAFEPMPGRDGTVNRYKTWLINDTEHEFLAEFDVFVLDQNTLRHDAKLTARTALEIGDLLADQLNDAPEVEVTLRRITTAGTDEEVFKTLKIRPKPFFKSFDFANVLNALAHTFVLLAPAAITAPKAAAAEPDPAEDLRTYTAQQVRTQRSKPKVYRSFEAFNVEEFASFEPEIDLHIRALLPETHAKLDPGEILRIQLQHLDRFLERAVRLGVQQVFVIHGMGEGKLRDAVANRLRQMPAVRKFKNEYHPKYGYGATEVLL
jgi:hypothetical protein